MKTINQKGIEIKYINADIKINNSLIEIISKNESKIIINIQKDVKININCEENSKSDIQIIFSSEIKLNLKAEKNSNIKLVHFGLGNNKIIAHLQLNEKANLIHAHGTISKNNQTSYADITNTLNEKSKTNITSRSILYDSSISEIKCMIKINKNGKNASGFQDLKTMIVDKKAISKIMPLLEIENNKVKCTHGAGTVSIDKNKLFYMRCKGIKKKNAIKIIKLTHLSNVINLFEDNIKNKIIKMI
jgi:Fe-S cluster assembly protein SufD